jgi:DNA-binding transcriptional LysR family regulator
MRGSEFAELSIFMAVAEHASFTKAAKHLGLSNATLSQTVRTLEERLGVRLLNRTTRSVALSEAGARLHSQLRPLLDDFDAAVDSVNAFRDRPAGHLRLSMPPPVATFILAPVLARFLQQYPEIALEISVGTQFGDIVAGRFDAGFRRGDQIAHDMVAVRVSQDIRFVAAATPAYVERHGRPRVPADLHSHSCIQFRLPDERVLPWVFCVDGKEVELKVNGPIITNDADLTISAALESIGVIYAVEEYVASMIKVGRLVRLLDESMLPIEDGFFMFYPSRRQNSAALRALIEFLRANLRCPAPLQPALSH